MHTCVSYSRLCTFLLWNIVYSLSGKGDILSIAELLDCFEESGYDPCELIEVKKIDSAVQRDVLVKCSAVLDDVQGTMSFFGQFPPKFTGLSLIQKRRAGRAQSPRSRKSHKSRKSNSSGRSHPFKYVYTYIIYCKISDAIPHSGTLLFKDLC